MDFDAAEFVNIVFTGLVALVGVAVGALFNRGLSVQQQVSSQREAERHRMSAEMRIVQQICTRIRVVCRELGAPCALRLCNPGAPHAKEVEVLARTLSDWKLANGVYLTDAQERPLEIVDALLDGLNELDAALSAGRTGRAVDLHLRVAYEAARLTSELAVKAQHSPDRVESWQSRMAGQVHSWVVDDEEFTRIREGQKAEEARKAGAVAAVKASDRAK